MLNNMQSDPNLYQGINEFETNLPFFEQQVREVAPLLESTHVDLKEVINYIT